MFVIVTFFISIFTNKDINTNINLFTDCQNLKRVLVIKIFLKKIYCLINYNFKFFNNIIN